VKACRGGMGGKKNGAHPPGAAAAQYKFSTILGHYLRSPGQKKTRNLPVFGGIRRLQSGCNRSECGKWRFSAGSDRSGRVYRRFQAEFGLFRPMRVLHADSGSGPPGKSFSLGVCKPLKHKGFQRFFGLHGPSESVVRPICDYPGGYFCNGERVLRCPSAAR
jgi:hypothetical protein